MGDKQTVLGLEQRHLRFQVPLLLLKLRNLHVCHATSRTGNHATHLGLHVCLALLSLQRLAHAERH